MRISDWSSDVCSSDLRHPPGLRARTGGGRFRRALPRHRAGPRRRSRENLADRRGRGEALTSGRGEGRTRWRPGLQDSHVSPSDFPTRSEEHTSELQSLMRISYAVFCLKKKTNSTTNNTTTAN